MRKITINGLEIECDDNVELAIEGNKITIKAAEKVVHEHHYHTIISTPPPNPYITQPNIGTPYSPPGWPITICSGTPQSDDPPATSGYVSIQPDGPGFLPNSSAAIAQRRHPVKRQLHLRERLPGLAVQSVEKSAKA
jgi:hypothetical protein